MSVELRRVVIATDFSKRSVHAARWAVRHFTHDAEVVLVHVVAVSDVPRFVRVRFPELGAITESAVAGATNRLREMVAALGAPHVRTEVRVGNAAEQIADVARQTHADLIVVGRHGDRPGLLHRIGTTADRLVRISPVSVLLATSMRDASPRHLLAALDDADITPRVVEWTRFLATHFKADILGLHVVTSAVLTRAASAACAEHGTVALTPSAIEAEVARDGVEWVKSVLGNGDSASAAAEVAFGFVAQEIVRAAERKNSELIVVGRTGSGLGRLMLLGGVTRQVLHSARCPVLVVVAPEGARSEQASAA